MVNDELTRIMPHSSLLPRHASLRPSSLVTRHSSLRHSSFIIHHSSFIIPSCLIVQHSSCTRFLQKESVRCGDDVTTSGTSAATIPKTRCPIPIGVPATGGLP